MEEEPTLEGLSNRVITDVVFGPDHSQDVDNALMVLDPVGTVLKSVGTWLCTEIAARHGIDKDDQQALSRLRRWAIKNEREDAELYFKQGYKLIDVINELENADDLYLDLKDKLVAATCDLVRKDDLQGAFAKYKEVTAGLCKEYGVIVKALPEQP